MFFPPPASISSLDIVGDLWVGIREKSLPRVATVAKFLDLNEPWSWKYGKKIWEKIHMYDFPVHVCSQEQNS